MENRASFCVTFLQVLLATQTGVLVYRKYVLVLYIKSVKSPTGYRLFIYQLALAIASLHSLYTTCDNKITVILKFRKLRILSAK